MESLCAIELICKGRKAPGFSKMLHSYLFDYFRRSFLVHIAPWSGQERGDHNNFPVDDGIDDSVASKLDPVIVVALPSDALHINLLRMIPYKQLLDRILVLRPYILMGFQEFVRSLRVLYLIVEIALLSIVRLRSYVKRLWKQWTDHHRSPRIRSELCGPHQGSVRLRSDGKGSLLS